MTRDKPARKQQCSILLTEEMQEAIRQYARDHQTTVSTLVEDAINDLYLKPRPGILKTFSSIFFDD